MHEWRFDERSGNIVNDRIGTKPIDMTLPASQSFAWTAKGINTTNGLIQPPALSGVKTFVFLMRSVATNSTGHAFSGTSVNLLGSQFAIANQHWSGHSRGVAPLWGRADTGAGCYRLQSGGWQLIFLEVPTTYSASASWGGRVSNTTNRVTDFELAYAACYSGSLTAGERDQLYAMARRLAVSRGFYLDWRDCPTWAYLILLWGQSNHEGRALNSGLSAPDQAYTYSRVYITRRDTRATALLQLGVNQTTNSPSTQHGPEIGLALAYEASGRPQSLYISKCGIGGTHLANSANTNDWSIEDLLTSSSTGDALNTFHKTEADMLHAGIGPYLLAGSWGQGESDAYVPAEGAAYETNLSTSFLPKIREQVMSPALPFVINRIRNVDPGMDVQAALDVRAAQVAVGSTSPNQWIDTDDCSLNLDMLHYAAAGQKLIGQRIYSAISTYM